MRALLFLAAVAEKLRTVQKKSPVEPKKRFKLVPQTKSRSDSALLPSCRKKGFVPPNLPQKKSRSDSALLPRCRKKGFVPPNLDSGSLLKKVPRVV